MTSQGRSRVRKDAHRPSAIEPADYSYVGAFDGAFPLGSTSTALAASVRMSPTSVYRDTSRCDHCGAHLRYAVVWRHEPTGENICTGEICATETMVIPDRMRLRMKRLKSRAKGRRERQARQEDAERRHPDATALLATYEARGGSNGFVLSVSRRYRRHGYLSDRQASAVLQAVERSVPRGRGADAADLRRRERGADLHRDGKVRRVEDGVYLVEGSDGGEYRVTLDPENCPCPDSEKGNKCKHVYGALSAEKGEGAVGGKP